MALFAVVLSTPSASGAADYWDGRGANGSCGLHRLAVNTLGPIPFLTDREQAEPAEDV